VEVWWRALRTRLRVAPMDDNFGRGRFDVAWPIGPRYLLSWPARNQVRRPGG
jgi:hypothetical protein